MNKIWQNHISHNVPGYAMFAVTRYTLLADVFLFFSTIVDYFKKFSNFFFRLR